MWGCVIGLQRDPACVGGLGRRARASLRHSGRGRRAKDTEPASEDIFGLRPRPRVPAWSQGWAPAWGVPPGRPPLLVALAGCRLRQDFCCDES